MPLLYFEYQRCQFFLASLYDEQLGVPKEYLTIFSLSFVITHSELNSTGLDAIGSGRVTTAISVLYLDYSNFNKVLKYKV